MEDVADGERVVSPWPWSDDEADAAMVAESSSSSSTT